MTLGEHIQQLRKEAGLSQEALGEALGVTRQSISKWESDGAIPEVEKLIAMSRLFGVTVGELLQVEESAPEGEVPHELTERELAAVEAIVAKYISAVNQAHAQPQPAPRPRHRKRNIVLAVLGVAAVLWAVGQIKTMNDRIQSLQTNLSNVRSDVNRQGSAMGSMTDRIEEILERQNSVTAAEEYVRESIDIAAETVTYRLEATPKEYREGMTARFTAQGSTRTVTADGVLDPATHGFSAVLDAPLDDEVTLSVSFTDTQGVQTRILGTEWPRGETIPGVSLSTWIWGDKVGEDGVFLWDSRRSPLSIDVWYAEVKQASGPIRVSVEAIDVQIYLDGKLLHTIPVDMALVDRRGDHSGGQEGVAELTGIVPDLELTLNEGCELLIVAQVTDNFGRTWYDSGEAYTVEDGRFDYIDWPDELPY